MLISWRHIFSLNYIWPDMSLLCYGEVLWFFFFMTLWHKYNLDLRSLGQLFSLFISIIWFVHYNNLLRQFNHNITFDEFIFKNVSLWTNFNKNFYEGLYIMKTQIFHLMKYDLWPDMSLLCYGEVLWFLYFKTFWSNYNLDLYSYG